MKAADTLRSFCDDLKERAKETNTVALDDFLAVKRTLSYSFEKETIGEAEKLAFELAFNFANGLIALTTGILALTITFRNDLVGTAPRGRSERWLKTSWVTYLVSIVAGIVTMMGIIGPLNPRPLNPQSFLFGLSITLPQTIQLISFVGATAFLVVYGVGAWTTSHRRK